MPYALFIVLLSVISAATFAMDPPSKPEHDIKETIVEQHHATITPTPIENHIDQEQVAQREQMHQAQMAQLDQMFQANLAKKIVMDELNDKDQGCIIC